MGFAGCASSERGVCDVGLGVVWDSPLFADCWRMNCLLFSDFCCDTMSLYSLAFWICDAKNLRCPELVRIELMAPSFSQRLTVEVETPTICANCFGDK